MMTEMIIVKPFPSSAFMFLGDYLRVIANFREHFQAMRDVAVKGQEHQRPRLVSDPLPLSLFKYLSFASVSSQCTGCPPPHPSSALPLDLPPSPHSLSFDHWIVGGLFLLILNFIVL